MQFTNLIINNIKMSRLTTEGQIINTAQDALDLMFGAGADRIIISKENLNPDFFTLSTGLAGEILQKFSNYNKYLAIIGDFSNITSKSLRDFIYESNKNRHILYLESVDKIQEYWR